MDKLNLRKKAMDSLLKESDGIKIAKKPKPEEMEVEKSGRVPFLVTAEEKEMILEMRKEKGGEETSEEEAEEEQE